MEELILIGAGGHGRDVADAALAAGRIVVGFLDDDPELHGTSIFGSPVLGGLERLSSHPSIGVVISLSAPASKRRIDDRVRAAGARLAEPIVHPAATVSRFAVLDDGVVVLAGAVIQAGARIGRSAYVHTASSISHDVRIEAYASLHPGVQIGGGASIGEGCFVGIGAVVLPGVRIGSGTTIGAGAVVLRDLPGEVTAVGVPARVVERAEDAT